MKGQKIIIDFYPSVIKRINSWILPAALVMLYFTGFWANNDAVLKYISRIGLRSFHSISGFILIFSLVIFVYDVLQRDIKTFYPGRNSDSEQTIYRFGIDILFYLCLALIGVLGFLLYMVRILDWQPGFINQPAIFISHIGLSGIFIALIPVKYYLSFIKWYKELLNYLREE
jgi:hypothetical protein